MPPKKLREANSETITEELLKGPTDQEVREAESEITVVSKLPDMVWVKFRNMIDPGLPVSFFYANVKAGIPRTRFTFEHDKIYKDPIPREIMEWINDRSTPITKEVVEDGNAVSKTVGFKYLYQCLEVKKPQ